METRYNLKSPGEPGWGGERASGLTSERGGRRPWLESRSGASAGSCPPALAAAPGSRFTRGRCGSRGAGRRAGPAAAEPQTCCCPLAPGLSLPVSADCLSQVKGRCKGDVSVLYLTPPGCTRIRSTPSVAADELLLSV